MTKIDEIVRNRGKCYKRKHDAADGSLGGWMMFRKLISGGLGALILGVAVNPQPASALGPVSALVSHGEFHDQGPLVDVSFWAEPFPFGYTRWGRCIRYERFETELGPRFRRVSICGASYGRHRSGRVLSVKG